MAKSEAPKAKEQVQPEGWLWWFVRSMWGHVLRPIFSGIVFGIASKLTAVAIRYFVLGRWLEYRKFYTPE